MHYTPPKNCCDLCGAVLGPVAGLPRLQRRIYWYVVKAGPAGVPTKDLLRFVYEGRTPTDNALRVHISNLNDVLRPTGVKVQSAKVNAMGRAGGRYFLLTLS